LALTVTVINYLLQKT